ncbi:hypothetical protein SKAU_G00288740 [Synaphobranchus kaupii]|uniref:RBR-type E3 ubiquitin transferase n=1 Tax=Synaphobranchus kaupii TaxID=118154 RepID=A0A9Q1IM64_SYNKA|nr:hypothetical protein SKAU_G00288740 [Synaphobranchus kaupii]
MCPGCQSCVEREDLCNLCVHCTVCTVEKGRDYYFCWQCLQSWKGPGRAPIAADNQGCTNKELELLQRCPTTSLPQVEGVSNCPSLRACPTCGQLLEHDRTGCKNLLCSRCQVEFCFVCLKLTAHLPADQLLLPALPRRGGPPADQHTRLEQELSLINKHRVPVHSF